MIDISDVYTIIGAIIAAILLYPQLRSGLVAIKEDIETLIEKLKQRK